MRISLFLPHKTISQCRWLDDMLDEITGIPVI
jgi:hypothetical protein